MPLPGAGGPEKLGDDWQPKVDINKQLHKTKLCKHFLKGKCRYGAECSYAHYQDEKRSLPDLRKTRVCKLFGQGKCNKADCEFAHGVEELRGTDGVWKTVLCSKWQQGSCRVGKRCRFAHGLGELRAPAAGADPAVAPLDVLAGLTEDQRQLAYANAALRQYAAQAAVAAHAQAALAGGGVPLTAAMPPLPPTPVAQGDESLAGLAQLVSMLSAVSPAEDQPPRGPSLGLPLDGAPPWIPPAFPPPGAAGPFVPLGGYPLHNPGTL